VFRWDPAKAERNLKKHGVSFGEAATAFDDPAGPSGRDLQHSDVELRYLWIGQSTSNRVLTISYTLRRAGDGETAIRIISARRANRKERKTYAPD
jgi:uncharacterized DUF497 family protein